LKRYVSTVVGSCVLTVLRNVSGHEASWRINSTAWGGDVSWESVGDCVER
jgi:hypothetical protein